MDFGACCKGAGGLRDSPAGRQKYLEYLEWLAEDECRKKALLFDRMSKGWTHGAKEFKKAVLESGSGAREAAELLWERQLERCLTALGRTAADSESEARSADWKVAIATRLKRSALCKNARIDRKLNMGSRASISRYCSELENGGRPKAKRLLDELCQ